MKTLTIKQKKLLKTWFNGASVKEKETISAEFLPQELWDKLEEDNDFETIFVSINVYLDELYNNWINGDGFE
jgi:hypothetical protein